MRKISQGISVKPIWYDSNRAQKFKEDAELKKYRKMSQDEIQHCLNCPLDDCHHESLDCPIYKTTAERKNRWYKANQKKVLERQKQRRKEKWQAYFVDYYTMEEAANELGVPYKYIYVMRKRGILPAEKILDRWMVPKAALAEIDMSRIRDEGIQKEDYSPKEAAAVLGCGAKNVLHLLKVGKLYGRKEFGRYWRIPKEAVEECLNKRKEM